MCCRLQLMVFIYILQVHHSASVNVATSNPAEEKKMDKPHYKPSASRYIDEETNRDSGDFTFRANWTKAEMIDLIEYHGYTSKEGTYGTIYVLIGDVLVYPHFLIPELGWSESRRNLLRKGLWLDKQGIAKVSYFFDTQTKADKTVFEDAVKTWGKGSCIKFTKLSPNPCSKDLGHAAVCVGSFGGCHSLLGRKYGPGMQRSQEMSVEPKGCEMVAAAHEFGHALGLNHEMSRADRDEYIRANLENIDLPLADIKNDRAIRGQWAQGGKCSPEQLYDAPKPYDSMSLMQYGSSDFAKEDARPVYLSLTAKYQYMFDYHRPSGAAQTHYDYYIINLGYQCIKRWKAACQKNGKGAPNCKNYGYITKDCKCACPVGFSGSTCSSKSGPMFPVQDRARAQVDVTKPGVVNMAGKGMKDDGDYILKDFRRYQFIGVFIKSGEGTRISVLVTHDFSKVAGDYQQQQDQWIKSGDVKDCQYGLRMYVGNQKTGFARTECVSSVINNEFKSESRVFTSKNNTLDIVGIGMWGLTPYGKPATTRKAMEFVFSVSFLEKPEETLSIENKYPGKIGALLSEATKKVGKTLKKNLPAVIGGAVALLLISGGIIGFFVWRRSRGGDDGSRGGIASLFKKSDSESSGSGSDSSSESD